ANRAGVGVETSSFARRRKLLEPREILEGEIENALARGARRLEGGHVGRCRPARNERAENAIEELRRSEVRIEGRGRARSRDAPARVFAIVGAFIALDLERRDLTAGRRERRLHLQKELIDGRSVDLRVVAGAAGPDA